MSRRDPDVSCRWWEKVDSRWKTCPWADDPKSVFWYRCCGFFDLDVEKISKCHYRVKIIALCGSNDRYWTAPFKGSLKGAKEFAMFIAADELNHLSKKIDPMANRE